MPTALVVIFFSRWECIFFFFQSYHQVSLLSLLQLVDIQQTCINIPIIIIVVVVGDLVGYKRRLYILVEIKSHGSSDGRLVSSLRSDESPQLFSQFSGVKTNCCLTWSIQLPRVQLTRLWRRFPMKIYLHQILKMCSTCSPNVEKKNKTK